MSKSPQEPDQQAASGSDGGGGDADTPSSLTFRITPISLLAVLAIMVCVTPVAWARPWLLVTYLIPVLLVVWILRVRTVVDANQVTVHTMFRRSAFTWDEVKSFRLLERTWLRAVLDSGKEVRLPAVRVRDLPRLAAISGGRLPDPTTSDASATAEGATAEGATAEGTAEAPAEETQQEEAAEATEDDTSREE